MALLIVTVCHYNDLQIQNQSMLSSRKRGRGHVLPPTCLLTQALNPIRCSMTKIPARLSVTKLTRGNPVCLVAVRSMQNQLKKGYEKLLAEVRCPVSLPVGLSTQ